MYENIIFETDDAREKMWALEQISYLRSLLALLPEYHEDDFQRAELLEKIHDEKKSVLKTLPKKYWNWIERA